jgi:hypothetical protein
MGKDVPAALVRATTVFISYLSAMQASQFRARKSDREAKLARHCRQPVAQDRHRQPCYGRSEGSRVARQGRGQRAHASSAEWSVCFFPGRPTTDGPQPTGRIRSRKRTQSRLRSSARPFLPRRAMPPGCLRRLKSGRQLAATTRRTQTCWMMKKSSRTTRRSWRTIMTRRRTIAWRSMRRRSRPARI